ncbi:MAG TPA: hypothetical protein VKB47_16575, partial [Terracidiphilus sp.]|nr:hypothetical protein [Terracidiphilus sp.]
GQTFKEINGRWWIALPGKVTKSGRPDERPVPAWLNRYIEAYLNQARPVLLGSKPPTAVSWPVAAQSQHGDRVRRIGVLQAVGESDPEAQLRRMAFVGALQKFGWTEGTNVIIDYRWAGGDADRIRLYATELTGMRPDPGASMTSASAASRSSFSGLMEPT